MGSVHDGEVGVGSSQASERRYNLSYAWKINEFHWFERKEITFQADRTT